MKYFLSGLAIASAYLVCTLPWTPVHTPLRTFFASYNYLLFIMVVSGIWLIALTLSIIQRSSLSWKAVIVTALFSLAANMVSSVFGHGDRLTGIGFGMMLFVIPSVVCTAAIVTVGKSIERFAFSK